MALPQLDSPAAGSGSIMNTPGVYGIAVRGKDAAGNTGDPEVIYLSVYDPSGSFVTGGGWVLSPSGALVGSTLNGKASFGFVSKYPKRATIPTGETEFNFHVANFNFHSQAYQWLVVSGPKAQYRGLELSMVVPDTPFS